MGGGVPGNAGCGLRGQPVESRSGLVAFGEHDLEHDGGAVEDNFGGQGEIAYVEDQLRLQRAAEAISATDSGSVLGPHSLYRTHGRPLVVNSAAFSRAVVEYLVRRYDVAYVVAERERASFYAGFLPGGVIWSDDRYLVWKLR